jgi:hypothetical protein
MSTCVNVDEKEGGSDIKQINGSGGIRTCDQGLEVMRL